MTTKPETDENIKYIGNDELYPTEITFSNGWKVRLARSEDGQKYLIVERV
jgi:nitrogen fixation protein